MSDFPYWCLSQIPVQDEWQIKRVGLHRANRTWKLEGRQQTLIVKQYRFDSIFGRSFRQLAELDKTIAETGLGAEVIWTSPGEGVVVSKYLEPPTLDINANREFAIQTLGEVSAQIHRIKPSQKRWDLRERVERYCRSLAQADPRKAEQFLRDCNDYQTLFDSWSQNSDTFCHNDLIAEHIFTGPPPRVIDWEYAGYGHPGFDLASTVIINDLDETEMVQLLEAYQQAGGADITPDNLRDWMRLVALVNHIWFTLQESLRTREDGRENTGMML